MKKTNVYDTDSELYIFFLETFFDGYYNLSNAERKNGEKYILKMFFLEPYDYNEWLKNVELTHAEEYTGREESDMPPLEGDKEEMKKGKGLKILTPNKLLTSLPILFAKIRGGNNLKKLKKEIRQILYLFYQDNKTTKDFYNNLIMSL